MKQYFKVTTQDMKSLGLRNNPTILKFSLGKWIKSPTIKKGKTDDGGIWTVATLSNAKKLVKYMRKQHKKNCRIFAVFIGKILFENNYRTKTDKVWFDFEIST